MKKITCNELWKEWMMNSPEDPMVLAGKEKLSSYSKDDWKNMSAEAVYLTEMLAELVLFNIPHESKIAETAFDALVKHFHEWFFPINKQYLHTLGIASGFDYKYSAFFNQFHPGLGMYLYKLVLVYLHKIQD